MTKQKYPLILISIFVFSAGIYLLLYFSTIQPKIAENKQLEKELSMYSTAAEQLEEDKNDIQQEKDISKLKLSIPTEKYPNLVLASINQLAANAKVTVTYLASIEGEEEPEGPFNEAMYKVEISGSNLSQINNFLNSIQESERLMTVDTLEINQQGTSISAIVALTTFYSK